MEWPRIVDEETARALQLNRASTMEVAKAVEAQWHHVLDSPLRQRVFKPMRWDVVVAVTLGLLVTMVFALALKARREHLGPLDRAQERAGFAFIMPWLVGFLALTMGP